MRLGLLAVGASWSSPATSTRPGGGAATLDQLGGAGAAVGLAAPHARGPGCGGGGDGGGGPDTGRWQARSTARRIRKPAAGCSDRGGYKPHLLRLGDGAAMAITSSLARRGSGAVGGAGGSSWHPL